MKLLVINGPNLNMLGIREPDIYGKTTYKDLEEKITGWGKALDLDVSCYQSNHEGDLVDAIQQAYFDHIDAIAINPGAYTHTSIAILDAVKAVSIPTVEVHISALSQREDFRQISYVRLGCIHTVSGQGIDGYKMAMELLKEHVMGRKGMTK